MSDWGMSLEQYIEYLLRMGKTRESTEFQSLTGFYGENRVVDKVNEIKARIKAEKEDRNHD